MVVESDKSADVSKSINVGTDVCDMADADRG